MCKSSPPPTTSAWGQLSAEFRQYHKNTLDVVLHFATTPLGWVGALRLLSTYASVDPLHAALFHTLTVALYTASVSASTGTLLLNLLSAYLAVNVDLPYDATAEYGAPLGSLGLVVIGYLLQDAAHRVTSEPTFQSSYADPLKFALHSWLLLPLCVDAFTSLQRGPLYWLVPRDTAIAAHIGDKASLEAVKRWVLASNPSKDTTTHWWYGDLTGDARTAFDRISGAPEIRKAFADVWDATTYAVEPVHGMDEVYVASPTQLKSSDAVFLMDHIDGPWIVWPFCSVYRALAAVNANSVVTTHLKDLRRERMLTSGDVLGFDFNRELHRVSFDETKEYSEQRITLKLHYVVYPKVLAPFGRLLAWVTTRYDIIARGLFLYTIKPKNFVEAWTSKIGVLLTTYAFDQFESWVGIHNVLRVLAIAVAARVAAAHAVVPAVVAALKVDRNLAAVGLPVVMPAGGAAETFAADPAMLFLCCTSFVHYTTYIATFYYRSEVNYGRLLRDCKFWKTLSIGQVVYYYAQCPVDLLSLAAVAAGYGLAAWATAAIGIDRTYFGAELDIVAPRWVSAFPYNCIPHPMILGAIVGLLGFHANEAFRTAFPLLVPAHCVLYLVHATQEHFNVHDEKWRELQRFRRAPTKED